MEKQIYLDYLFKKEFIKNYRKYFGSTIDEKLYNLLTDSIVYDDVDIDSIIKKFNNEGEENKNGRKQRTSRRKGSKGDKGNE